MSKKLVVIGASTGGPKILRQVCSDLPLLDASIVLVQHMPKFINESIRTTLDGITEMKVKMAEDGEWLKEGNIYIAPSDLHLRITNNNRKISLSNGEKVNFVCPSIDVTMESLKSINGDEIMVAILTGMGKDGAEGISHIKNIGGLTIAEDKDSCMIYGMPKAAVETGDVDLVMTPEEVRSKIIEFGS